MTIADLHLIGHKLGITLPDNYKQLMENYPFSGDSFTAELMNRTEDLLDAAETDLLPPHSYCIGNDGVGTLYFLDLARLNSPVFAYDRKMDLFYEQASNLQEFVAKCWEAEKALAEAGMAGN